MEGEKLSERDICTKFIIPALLKSGWKLYNILTKRTFTLGRYVL
ncbi:hypothetical protein SAMN05880501_107203 [Ureibacillus xyleni]|uniref:Uncharacterized protein n=1 Tax=Ureibacillus xyleni TaxID=614648 RepID=A0A285SXS1_9BACL|nr:hypothetical protein SAMN05880501_107203 [Ureibacillus xyleni]